MPENEMTIREIKTRDENLVTSLLSVWEESVRATHLFLTEDDICRIRKQVPDGLKQIEILIVAEDDGKTLGFMGIAEGCLEMLFLHPEARGKGLGRQLLELAVSKYGVAKLCVNEQNPNALGFYEHMGFTICGRSETDDAGNPFPLLHMVLQKK